MSKTLAVVGATGQQGGSILNFVLNDPELSREYKIRALTRDVASQRSKALAAKVEVVQADVHDRVSLEKALTGAHTVFAMTHPPLLGSVESLEIEYNQAKVIADTAIEKGAEYIIFSTLPPLSEISGGKYTKCWFFEAKAKAERYIRSLPIKSAFYAPGYFMENFTNPKFDFLAPKRQIDDVKWVLTISTSPQSRMPLIDVVGDTGKFIGAILAEPDRYEGKISLGADRLYTWEEIAAVMSKATGKEIVAQQVSTEEYKKGIPVDPNAFLEMAGGIAEFGYYGSEDEKMIAWAVANTRGGTPSTLEEFLQAHPLQLS